MAEVPGGSFAYIPQVSRNCTRLQNLVTEGSVEMHGSLDEYHHGSNLLQKVYKSQWWYFWCLFVEMHGTVSWSRTQTLQLQPHHHS